MHPHIYHFIYSATANVNTLIRTPSTSKSVDAQATGERHERTVAVLQHGQSRKRVRDGGKDAARESGH